MLSIVSYNVNGLRSAISKGLADWLAREQFDFVCLQETKAQPEDLAEHRLEDLGYHLYYHSAVKKGYSGVAIFSKQAADRVVVGTALEKYDHEGRVLRADYGDWTLVSAYFPSGTTGEVRQQVKMEFLDDFFKWSQELKKERPKLIIVGDYNIAHTEIDIHDPKGNKKTSGFLPEERAWMTKWFNSGFADAFRIVNPTMVEYSWWSFRAGARGKNKGWRIDYQSVSDPLRDQVKQVRHLGDVVHSDHCPVLMQIDL